MLSLLTVDIKGKWDTMVYVQFTNTGDYSQMGHNGLCSVYEHWMLQRDGTEWFMFSLLTVDITARWDTMVYVQFTNTGYYSQMGHNGLSSGY